MKPAAIGIAVCIPKGPPGWGVPGLISPVLQVQVRSLAAPKRLAGPLRVPCKETKGAGLGTLGFRGTQACSVPPRRWGKVSNSLPVGCLAAPGRSPGPPFLHPRPSSLRCTLFGGQALAPPPAARTFRTVPARAQARAGKTPRGTSEELAQQELQECRR